MNDVVDMSQFVEAKSDQLNSDDLLGAPRTITVRKVAGNDGDQPVSIFYEGDGGKPFRPCKTMRRVLLAVWGKNAADYVGRSMTLYRDDSVTFGGLNVGGIRISHMSHMDKETVVVVMKTKGKKAGIKIQPLKTEPREDEAAKWADKFTATVARAPDADKLEQYVSGQGGTLERLKQQRPELYAACETAIENARSSFGTWGEGPSDTDRGEAHTADPATLRKQIDEATDRDSWKAAENAVGAADLTDEQRLELSHALNLKEQALKHN